MLESGCDLMAALNLHPFVKVWICDHGQIADHYHVPNSMIFNQVIKTDSVTFSVVLMSDNHN